MSPALENSPLFIYLEKPFLLSVLLLNLLLTWITLDDVLGDEVFGPIIVLAFCYKEKR